MKNICIGDKFQIQCYKHDGNVHRCWEEAVVLEINKDYIVCGNNQTLVTRSEGVSWRTREPAIMYFFKNEWYNVIAQLKSDGIYYYCNIASPYIIEEDTIKYIDYDLDLRVFPDGKHKILDKNEYQYHKKVMKYSDELDQIITSSLQEIINWKKEGKGPFQKELLEKYYADFEKIKN